MADPVRNVQPLKTRYRGGVSEASSGREIDEAQRQATAILHSPQHDVPVYGRT